MADTFHEELFERYLDRSLFFWKRIRDARFFRWQRLARSASWGNIVWDWDALGISNSARAAAESFGFVPSEVFAHPSILDKEPELFEYYRLVACLPNKGFNQIKSWKKAAVHEKCLLLNTFISALMTDTHQMNRNKITYTMFAEAGSEWQGTWVNNIGLIASHKLETVLRKYALDNELINEEATAERSKDGNYLILNSGNSIRFGSEPDVECRNKKESLICVIEIKGSTDRAGAQTRLGETKKSFSKAKLENPRCTTIFLPSILTQAVKKQLSTERDIDKVFNLQDILRGGQKHVSFVSELFKYILREDV